jgi:aerobic carbon-monoxide dehydrogenase medium subunit
LRPKSFDYFRPKTLDEAVKLLQRYGDRAKILAGGQSLVPLMKLRLAEPEYLIDITSLTGLRYIRDREEQIEIGGLVTHHEIETSESVRLKAPSLRDAALVLGDPLIRNRGTVGGAICHADPAADYPAVLVSLGAKLFSRGPDGEREIASKDFFLDFFTTALQSDEILVSVSIPSPKKREGTAYLKMERVVGDFAIVGAAARVKLDAAGKAEEVHVVLSAVGNRPIIPSKMVERLVGTKLDETTVAESVEEIRKVIDPPSDIRASSQYRVDMAVVHAKRAVLDAARRARGETPMFVPEVQSLRAY